MRVDVIHDNSISETESLSPSFSVGVYRVQVLMDCYVAQGLADAYWVINETFTEIGCETDPC